MSERIIQGIESLSDTENIAVEKTMAREYSNEEKAERLWALWSDFRRKKYEFIKAKKSIPRANVVKEEFETQPEIQRIRGAISELWNEGQVQTLFRHHLEQNLSTKEQSRPSFEEYRQKEKELGNIRKQRETLFRDLFVHRGQEPDELTQIDLAESSIKGQAIKEELSTDRKTNPELAARVEFETIRDYHSQYERDGFIWAPSREKLFSSILEHLVLLDKNKPVLLTGETGTGKTRLARATAERLTGRPAFEVSEEAKSDIRPILGSQAIGANEEGENETYISYGPLGQAVTGKRDSRQKESDGGGMFYGDELNGYPPDALRSLIKQLAGRKPGEVVSFAAWRGQAEKIADRFCFLGSANLPSEKHPDRPVLPVEITRELLNIEVGYPEQSLENPETYEMMLAVLMDQNGRVRLKQGELEPEWEEQIDPATNEKRYILDENPISGGTLWRFANLIAEIQQSYQGKENILTPAKRDASYLETAVLDHGLILSWLAEYRISVLRQGVPLKEFLQEKLTEWSAQKTFPESDRNLLKDFFTAYDLPIEGSMLTKKDATAEKIYSEREIGYLSPRVARPSEKVEAPKPKTSIAFLEDGSEVEYTDQTIAGEWQIGEEKFIVLGKTAEDKLVLSGPENKIVLANQSEFEKIQQDNYIEAIIAGLFNPEKSDSISKIVIEKFSTREQRRKQAELQRLINTNNRQGLKEFLGA